MINNINPNPVPLQKGTGSPYKKLTPGKVISDKKKIGREYKIISIWKIVKEMSPRLPLAIYQLYNPDEIEAGRIVLKWKSSFKEEMCGVV